ncbi:MAG: AsmA family protein [Bdellovibrionales bacterium]
MRKLLKLIVSLIFFILVVFAVLTLFVATLDANKFRPELAERLSEKVGREITLDGPISFSLGLQGVRISAEKASLANPDGTSRGSLASIGKLEFGIDPLPLLEHRLSVNELSVANADILLETDSAGRHNWDFGASAQQKPANGKVSAPALKKGTSVKINNLKIVNSQIAFRNADGKRSGINISSLELDMRDAGTDVTLKGDIKGIPVTAAIKTDIIDLLNLKQPFSIDADVAYNVVQIVLSGKVDIAGKRADFSTYTVSARDTRISGKFSLTWAGLRPELRGTVNSDVLNPADFKSGILTTDNEGQTHVSEEQKAQDDGRFISNDPLPLDMFRVADADLSVTVGMYPVNKGSLNKIRTRLVLSGGNLVLDPVKAYIGASPVDVRVALDASKPVAHADMRMIAKEVDLGDLQKISGMMSFMKGKASAEVHLAGDGNTPRAIASSFGGIIEVTASKGEIFTGTAAEISSLLGSIFGINGNDNALNCLAARFIAKEGVLASNGILIDSATSTIMGNGNVNLGNEAINILLLSRAKVVDIGGLIPSLKIKGTLKKPQYSVKAADILKNVVGSLTEGNINVVGSKVPEIQQPPVGQNACVYTLDHPRKEKTPNVLPANIVDRAAQELQGIQNIGDSLLKGLFKQ